jgi:hypothetical protein
MLLVPLGCSDGSPAPAPTAKESGATPVPATTRATDERTLEDKLYGTWLARDVDTKMGEVKIKLTFREEGPMKLAAWSDIPFVGQVRDKTAPYDVQGNVISSDAIRGGTSVEYSFDGDDLIIKYKEGKTVRFKRQ